MWTLDQLFTSLNELKNNDIIAEWAVYTITESKEEFYFLGENNKVSVDQTRSVTSESYKVRVVLDKPGDLVGTAAMDFVTSMEIPQQMDGLLSQARTSEEKSWTYGDLKEQLNHSTGETCYLPIKEDLSSAAIAIKNDLVESIEATEGGVFNSSELFVIFKDEQTYLSNGFRTENYSSLIYSEVCFSCDKEGKSEEFMVTSSGVHPEQLNFKKMCLDSVENSKNLLNVESGLTPGNYNVLIDSSVLVYLFSDLNAHFRGDAEYNKFPHYNLGDSVIEGTTGFNLKKNPQIDYSVATKGYDFSGVALKPLTLVEDGKVVSKEISLRMGQYLNRDVTGVGSTLEVNVDKALPLSDLKKSKDLVVEILQFSGLFTSWPDMTFSSEIRLAKVYDNKTGKEYYLKGGNLSGAFKENFKGVLWSEEETLANMYDTFVAESAAYKGPKYALLSNVSISF